MGNDGSSESPDDITRVRLIKPSAGPLAEFLGARLFARTQTLRGRVADLDRELGFRYPTIEIIPVCFRTSADKDAVVFARTTYRCFEGTTRIVVQVSALTIVGFSDDEVDGVLAHEWLHYVWQTIEFAKAVRPTPTGDLISSPNDSTNDAVSFDEYTRDDSQRQVEDSSWLSERLARLCRRITHSGPGESGLLAYREWLRLGYPTEMMSLSHRFTGSIDLDETLVARAGELGLLS